MVRGARFVIGGVLAAALLAGVYFLLPQSPPSASANIAPAAGEVDAGFIGIVNFGHWRLICELPDNAAPRANSCRVNQEVAEPGRPDRVILAANLFARANRAPALVLRLPASAHNGDMIVLRFGGVTLKTPVHDCSQNECLASAELSDDDWDALIAANTLQAILPTKLSERALVDISPDGLSQAASALNRAEGIAAN